MQIYIVAGKWIVHFRRVSYKQGNRFSVHFPIVTHRANIERETTQLAMARTKRTARKSTGEKAAGNEARS